MSIRVLHYITGDTQKLGFGKIGGSSSFPADQLPYLNNGEILSEKARVSSSGGSRLSSGGIQLQSRVWEYQTGSYGRPVIIQTMVAIGTGRSHGFSEYVLGDTEEIADIADPWQVIQAAEKSSVMLDLEKFMAISGKNEIEFEDEFWNTEEEEPAQPYEQDIDPEWKLALLSHYWKQASIRAFSEDPPSSVHVHLGEFGDSAAEDNAETIRQAKLFFSSVIALGLPKQVQNIASMAAGVNGGDTNTLYAALEFNNSQNRDGEDTFSFSPKQRFPRSFRLNAAEREFIEAANEGHLPEACGRLFHRYQELAEQPDITETETPFMADYRLLYGIYCLDQITKEGHAFIERAELEKDLDNSGKAGDARICFLLLRNVRRYLEKNHKLNEKIRKTFVTELLEPLETAIFQVMLESMKQEQAEPFMTRRSDMLEFHHRLLYTATQDQVDPMISLTVYDQKNAKAPQFVRCFPDIPLRHNTDADDRNSRVLDGLLREVIRPLIEAELGHEKIESKYLVELSSDEFQKWVHSAPKTEETFLSFLREEIQDDKKHFLLYRITMNYLPPDELLVRSFEHMSQNNASPSAFPTDRQIHIVKNAFDRLERNNPDCIEAMNRYYLACFRKYREGIRAICHHNDVNLVESIGHDTTGAMVLIFSGEGKRTRMSPEEAKAVFSTFGGPQNKYAKMPQVLQAYSDMLDTHRNSGLASGDEDVREQLVDWLSQMAAAAPFQVDTATSIEDIFKNATTGSKMKPNAVEKVFSGLLPFAVTGMDRIRGSFKEMVQGQFERELNNQDSGILEWVSSMISVSGNDFPLDTTDILKRVFEAGKAGKRLSPAEVGTAFETMKNNAEGLDTKVRRAYEEMLSVRRSEAQQTQDKEAFEWLCDMANKAPWKDPEWITEQHSENVIFLCDLHKENGEEIDRTSRSMVRGWVEEGTVNAKGKERLQMMCNESLIHQNTEPAQQFIPFFSRINENNQALKDYLFDQTEKELTEKLEEKKLSYSQIVSEVAAKIEKTGRKLDELYEKVQSPVEQYLKEYFARNTEIAPLIREMEEIPPDNRFCSEWRNYLSEQVNSQQVALFNSQPNLEKIRSLRDDILSFGNRTDPMLTSAYQLIDEAEKRFRDLKELNELEAVSSVGETANEFDRLLSGASDVRKKLCSVLTELYPSPNEMKKISSRHELCAEILEAELSENRGSGNPSAKDSNQGLNWTQVLHRLFSKQELETATKKPYDPKHLPVLQRLLSVIESVRLMKAYGLRDSWAEDLIKTVHSDRDFHAYQSALARNKKKSELFQLEFDSDGLVFNMNE